MATNWTDDDDRGERGPSIAARIYGATEGCPRPAPLVLHLHGGAFVGGSLDNGQRGLEPARRSRCRRRFGRLSAGACSIPFRKRCTRRFRRCAWMHARRADWVTKKSGLFVAGEEAGGNLAAALALMARDQQAPPLAGQILLSPMLDPCMATCSVRQAEAGPVGCQWADGWHQYLGSPTRLRIPMRRRSARRGSRVSRPRCVLTAAGRPDARRDPELRAAPARIGCRGPRACLLDRRPPLALRS